VIEGKVASELRDDSPVDAGNCPRSVPACRLAVSIWLLFEIRTLLLLLVVSIFFCYLVAPIVHLLEQPVYIARHELRVPRPLAIALVYLLIAVVLFGGVQLIWPPLSQQVADLAKDLPGYATSAKASVDKIFNDANSWMRHVRLPPQWRMQFRSSERTGKLVSTMVDGFSGGALAIFST
jgi:predicted PurR-regulated permease PerM